MNQCMKSQRENGPPLVERGSPGVSGLAEHAGRFECGVMVFDCKITVLFLNESALNVASAMLTW